MLLRVSCPPVCLTYCTCSLEPHTFWRCSLNTTEQTLYFNYKWFQGSVKKKKRLWPLRFYIKPKLANLFYLLGSLQSLRIYKIILLAREVTAAPVSSIFTRKSLMYLGTWPRSQGWLLSFSQSMALWPFLLMGWLLGNVFGGRGV